MTTKTTTTTMTIAMIHHADVVRPIKTTLRSFGVRKQDLEDGVAEVQTRTLEYLRGKPLPASTEEWVALCVTITRNWRLDEKKKAKTARKYCEGLCEDPDDRIGIEPAPGERETIDARRLLRELEKQLDAGEMPERADEILDCVQAGMTYPEIAKELGITARAARSRMDRLRVLFKARLAKLGLSSMLLVLVVLASGSATAANQPAPMAPRAQVPVPPPRARSVG
ncbi:MAG: sigma-70 family RNA polymerase sigma factor [Polyangiaceae bacterium]